jgi:hypothetical protein
MKLPTSAARAGAMKKSEATADYRILAFPRGVPQSRRRDTCTASRRPAVRYGEESVFCSTAL